MTTRRKHGSPLGDIGQCPETFLVVASEGRVLLASDGWRRWDASTGIPGVLLNTPQHKRSPHPALKAISAADRREDRGLLL